MGGVKKAWMEAEERGWEAPDKNVCAECVEDEHLKTLIEASARSPSCDYCGRTSKRTIATAVEVLLPPIMAAINHYFAEPAGAGVPYESAEGGYLVEPMNTYEVFDSISFECNEDFIDDVADAILNDAWVPAAGGHWASEQNSQRLLYGWNSFSEHVRHRQRYFFSSQEAEFGPDIAPGDLMPALGSVVARLELIDSIASGTEVFRARFRAAADLWPMDADNLGPPPSQLAAAGRMNPPGISYLYLALDKATALAEIVSNPPVTIAIARFATNRDLRILNLVDLPSVPSVFEEARFQDRELILFLENFIYAISRPVRKDGNEHVEYIPSQVVCEYFASVFSDDQPLDGILYPSAIREGGRNLVLFPRGDSADKFQNVSFVESWEESAENWAELAAML